jgi:hypothetical protein
MMGQSTLEITGRYFHHCVAALGTIVDGRNAAPAGSLVEAR